MAAQTTFLSSKRQTQFHDVLLMWIKQHSGGEALSCLEWQGNIFEGRTPNLRRKVLQVSVTAVVAACHFYSFAMKIYFEPTKALGLLAKRTQRWKVLCKLQHTLGKLSSQIMLLRAGSKSPFGSHDLLLLCICLSLSLSPDTHYLTPRLYRVYPSLVPHWAPAVFPIVEDRLPIRESPAGNNNTACAFKSTKLCSRY